jgi:hypothetical protein
MQKIPTLFVRNFAQNPRLVTSEINPEAAWVLQDPRAIPTRKFDGTACLLQEGKLFKRYDAKKGKTPPANFLPAQAEPDALTGHWPGWVPVGDGPEDRFFREALEIAQRSGQITPDQAPWTYELVGPKVQGNAEHRAFHALVPHGMHVLRGVQLLAERGTLSFETIRDYLVAEAIEGIVWWQHLALAAPKAKIKRTDFGLPWPIPALAEEEEEA